VVSPPSEKSAASAARQFTADKRLPLLPAGGTFRWRPLGADRRARSTEARLRALGAPHRRSSTGGETMKRLRPRILGLTLLALFALGAVSAGSASAEEGVLNPAAFTIKGTSATFLTLAKEELKCKTTSGTGKFLTEKEKDQHATGSLTFEGCEALGFRSNTLDQVSGSGIVKVNALFLICLVEPKKLVFGVLVQPTETLHVEVPSIKSLLLLKGAFLVELETEGLEGKLWNVVLKGANGDQVSPLKCEINGTVFKYSFESASDTKADLDVSVEALADVTFAETVKLMDT
jgi:hypothetical protein